MRKISIVRMSSVDRFSPGRFGMRTHVNQPLLALSALTILATISLACGGTSISPSPSSTALPAPTPTPAIPTPLPGRYGIFVMRLDGSELHQIFGTDLRPGGVRPSADGTQLLLQFHYRDVDGDGQFSEADMSAIEIGVIATDGTNFRRLTDNDAIDALPLWSPDSTEILFTSNRRDGEKLDLFLMDVNGERPRPLTQTPDIHEGDPDWVGDTIVYTHNAADDEVQSIWAMSSDGTNPRQVTFPPSRGESGLVFNYGDYDPRLSPDGQQVAFERLVDDEFFFVDRQIGRWDIVVANLDGSGERNLTHEMEAAGFPKWSPDGQTILFLSHRVEDDKPLIALYTIGADGSDRQKVPVRLRNLGLLGGEWMPDGEHIVFAAEIYR
jgi:Tol biopolymer transport system component